MPNTIQSIRLKNFMKLASDFRFSKDFCDKIGITPSYFSQIKNGSKKNIGNLVARRAEELMSLPEGYLDVQHNEGPDRRRSVENPDRTGTDSLLNAIHLLSPSIREQLVRMIYSVAAEMPRDLD